MISTKYLSNNYFLIGLSSDEKPIDGITNGTAYLEMDTGTVYVLDAENARWLELGGETPLPVEDGNFRHELTVSGYGIEADGKTGVWTKGEDLPENTIKFIFYTRHSGTATTLEELFDKINSEHSEVIFTWKSDEDSDTYSKSYYIQPITLFDNKSKLLFGNVLDDEVRMVITSFTDTIIPENV